MTTQDNQNPDVDIHEDFNKMIAHFMPLAHEMLKEENNFVPFGGILTSEGEIEFISCPPDEGNTDMAHILTKNTAEIAKKIADMDVVGTIMVMNTTLSTPENPDMTTDCVVLQMEHAQASPVNAFCPYKKEASGEINFSKLFGTPGQAQFLAS